MDHAREINKIITGIIEKMDDFEGWILAENPNGGVSQTACFRSDAAKLRAAIKADPDHPDHEDNWDYSEDEDEEVQQVFIDICARPKKWEVEQDK